MRDSFYGRRLDYYASLSHEQREILFEQTAEELRRKRLALDISRIPNGISTDAVSGIEGVHTLRECLGDLLIKLNLK